MILDSDWEAEFCRVVEAHPRVRAYVKNHNLGLEVPYRYGSESAHVPARLHRPGRRRPRRRRPAAPGRRDQGLPARGREGEEVDDGDLLGARREQPRARSAAGRSPSSPTSTRSRPSFEAKVEDAFDTDDRRRRGAAGGERGHDDGEGPAHEDRRRRSRRSRTTRPRARTSRPPSTSRSYEERSSAPIRVAYERRNRDLDPQLVWRGKDEQDWSDLVVHAPPLYIQEKVHPKVLIDDLLRAVEESAGRASDEQIDLFADFNGMPEGADKTEFYQHDQNWTNRMILGDSLQVMASLAEREGLRGKVQCIYIDPPYGIKFNSNFQWSTTSRDVKDGNATHITREPEQVKAFRDTWRDGIHSYLTYLRDRLTVARDLLAESGSIFVQIGDENVHRVRA